MKQKNNMLEQEVIDLKDVIEGKDREISKLKRAQDRLKRDLRMTKEEISILGGAGYNN
jgi:FtsZ-binding cell division protein ZapB